MLSALPNESVDLVFADPPFNLGKQYGEGVSDCLETSEYLNWSQQWLGEGIRILKPGGSLFVFNLPKWCIEYGAYLNRQGMTFRHWIACRMPKAFPRGKKMSPAHYGLIYYTKGEPAVFNKVYTPIQVCRHCKGEIRDYGGHRRSLNEKGINLMDVWDMPEDVWENATETNSTEALWTVAEEMWSDIPPVRHRQHKKRVANELAPIMLERIVAMASNPEQIVIDPFGGSEYYILRSRKTTPLLDWLRNWGYRTSSRKIDALSQWHSRGMGISKRRQEKQASPHNWSAIINSLHYIAVTPK